MGEPAKASTTYNEYLELEERAEVRHEYLDGHVRAMSGGTVEHARLAARLIGLLMAHLGTKPCAAFSSDLKIRIDAVNRTTYADATVVCGSLERSPLDAQAIVNPRVLVEVLSDSTEAYDRGEKFRHYRRLVSLGEYVLVSQHEPLVEVWRRCGAASIPRAPRLSVAAAPLPVRQPLDLAVRASDRAPRATRGGSKRADPARSCGSRRSDWSSGWTRSTRGHLRADSAVDHP